MMGLTATGRANVGYCYVIEFLTPTWALIYSTISGISFVVTFIVTVCYIRFISKELIWIILFGVVLGYISVIGVFFYLDESPLFLLKTN